MNPPSDPHPVPTSHGDLIPEPSVSPDSEISPSDPPEEREEQDEPQPEQNSEGQGDEIQTESGQDEANPLCPSEPEPEPPVPVTIPEQYMIFSFVNGSPPKILHAFTRKDVGQLVRELTRNENQYLFIVRGGELGQLFKTKRGLIVQFEESRDRFKIRFSEHGRPVENGWIGEPD